MNGITAGATNTTGLALGFSTTAATTINATVAVKETSDGTGIDTLVTTNLGTVDVPVTITVDNYATAAIEQQAGPGTLAQTGSVYTLNLGTFSAGQDPITADFDLLNTAVGQADTLSGPLSLINGATALSNTGLGSLTDGAAYDVTLATDTAGNFSETIVFAGAGSNPSGFSRALPNETLVVTGAVESPAVPIINTTSLIDFDNLRQNATAQQAISITNAASAGSAFLDVYTGGASGAGMTAVRCCCWRQARPITAVPGGAGYQPGRGADRAGVLNIQSDTGPNGTQHFLEGGTIAVQGTVYREAAPELASLGIVYLHGGGTTVPESIMVQNTAVADGYSEKLLASVNGALIGGAGAFTVAAGGQGIDGLGILDLGKFDVPVTCAVDNYATAELAQTGGNGLMTPTSVSNTYTLNLGATEQYAAALTASVEVLNAAQGPAADLLTGGIYAIGDSEYVNAGFVPFSNLAFGTADTSSDIVLNTGTIGTSTETVVLSSYGTNASGYSGSISSQTIDVVGTIVAQPPPAPPPLPTAIAWGDVHLTTFDGLYYNFQAEGEFVLAQSTVAGDSFQVQARIQPYSANSIVSVITMLAAEVGTDRVTIGLGRTDAVAINGTGYQFAAIGQTQSLGAGGSITEVAANSYQINWATGEVMNVTLAGNYINMNLTLSASDGPGSVQGLLGRDSGQANGFQLADGTVLPQPLDSSTLYGAFANAWRVIGSNSLMDYLAGQTTATFTDTNFPADSINLDSLPAAILQHAEQEVIAAGISHPNQQAAAVIDLLVTGKSRRAAGTIRSPICSDHRQSGRGSASTRSSSLVPATNSSIKVAPIR